MNQILENYLNRDILAQAFPTVLAGFWVTVQVALCVIILGVGLGLALALLRLTGRSSIGLLVTAWVELFRSLPQLVISVFIYFALPYGGIALSPFASTALALGAVLSAFCAEIFHASIIALPKGQWEAATALGLRTGPTLFLIILPQACASPRRSSPTAPSPSPKERRSASRSRCRRRWGVPRA
jgi:His/Glu/Gln/Arg/opine family amino acid ABC transporter permease subunit